MRDIDAVDVGIPQYVAAILRRGRAGARRSFAAGFELAIWADRRTGSLRHARGQKLDRLHALLEQEDVEGILDWFDREFPAHVRLVPEEYRRNFAFGALRAYQQRDR